MNEISILTKKKRFATSRDLHGIFFEDINRVGDGGLYPEMLRNRSFEDSLVPEDCRPAENGKYFITPTGYKCAFNNGEGLDAWVESIPPTPIPAWYVKNENQDVSVSLDCSDTLNPKRKSSLAVVFARDNSDNSVYNIGYTGINAQSGEAYRYFMFAKTDEKAMEVTLSLRDRNGGKIHAQQSVTVQPGGYRRYDCILQSGSSDTEATFHIASKDAGALHIGFASLMPKDTFMGRENGMRKDIALLLKNMNAGFMRFPGGCIVEGLTPETAMKFENTIGPVWERPSHWLIWFYRATNGLGFHEYLQLCEDIGVEPMYVVNCGMTCQGRNPDFFDMELTESFLRDAIHAIEYATADKDTYWGQKRAENGHPEPFRLKYIEIGNENRGEEYNIRYRLFYDTLKSRYPNLIYISNTHTELEGLPTEIADEHFYNDSEFFVSLRSRYDGYDRSGPKIFVGEYAVTFNKANASLYSALGEASFLTGVENNQDLVPMTCYAPLFMNADYRSWYPNLIVFNNHESFGIPSYHMVKMMGRSIGDYVPEFSLVSGSIKTRRAGRAGLYAQNAGTVFANVSVNGLPQKEAAGTITGSFAVFESSFTAADESWCLLGEEAEGDCTISAEVTAADPSGTVKLSVWNERMESIGSIFVPYWAPRRFKGYEWVIENGQSCVRHYKRGLVQSESDTVGTELGGGAHKMEMSARGDRIECRLDGKLLHIFDAETLPAVTGSAAVDEKNGDVIVKLVNISDRDETVRIRLDAEVEPAAKGEILTSEQKEDTNGFEEKEKVSPKEFTLDSASSDFAYTASRYSLSILRLKLS